MYSDMTEKFYPDVNEQIHVQLELLTDLVQAERVDRQRIKSIGRRPVSPCPFAGGSTAQVMRRINVASLPLPSQLSRQLVVFLLL